MIEDISLQYNFLNIPTSENKQLSENDVEIYPLDLLNLELHNTAVQHIIDKFGKVFYFDFDLNINNCVVYNK